MYNDPEYHKKYRENNKEKLKAYHREYREDPKNKERYEAYQRENRDRINAKKREYREKEKQLLSTYGKDYREKNRDEINRKQKERRAAKKEQEAIMIETSEFTICDVKYKIGAHGFIYYECDGEWMRSSITRKELKSMMRIEF